jgi:hypothetical protein
MPIIHRDKGAARKWTDEDIAEMERLTETMSLPQIALKFGVCSRVIQRQIAEHGTPSADVYKPRVIARWPHSATFKHDNLQVRD